MFTYGNLIYTKQAEVGADGGDGDGGAAPETYSAEDFNALQSQLNDQVTQNTAMNGKLNELLGETKAAKQAKQQLEETQRLEAAKNSTSMDDFESELRSQFKVASDVDKIEITRLNDIILGGSNKNAITELAALFEHPEAGKLMLQNMVKSKHSENNSVVTNFTDSTGNLITTDGSKMVEWLKNNKTFQPFLKGVDSSGGMDGNSRPAASGGEIKVTDKQARIDAINKRFK
jgi:hypothetical protein